MQVRVTLVEDKIYLGKLHLKVLKFVELTEEQVKNFSSDGMQNEDAQQKEHSPEIQGSLHEDSDDGAKSETSNVSMSKAKLRKNFYMYKR